jgi:hypothetical protein
LEDELNIRSPSAEILPFKGDKVLAVKAHGPLSRLDQSQDPFAGGGLAATRLPDQRQRSATGDLKRDPVHRPDLTHDPL